MPLQGNGVGFSRTKLALLVFVNILLGGLIVFAFMIVEIVNPLREQCNELAHYLWEMEAEQEAYMHSYTEPELPDSDTEALEHYDSNSEISFIMNSHTNFVPVPADMVWVRTIDFSGTMVSPAPDGTFTVENDQYMWEIDPKELKKLCGDGSRAIPVKVTICNKKTGKDKIMHITDFLMQFRPNGSADISAHGYIFDK